MECYLQGGVKGTVHYWIRLFCGGDVWTSRVFSLASPAPWCLTPFVLQSVCLQNVPHFQIALRGRGCHPLTNHWAKQTMEVRNHWTRRDLNDSFLSLSCWHTLPSLFLHPSIHLFVFLTNTYRAPTVYQALFEALGIDWQQGKQGPYS